MAQPFSSRYQHVLGTELHVLVGGGTEASAGQAQRRVLEEILRLEALLSTYRPDTPLSRWRRSEVAELPREVVGVLVLARDWFRASEGAFNPGLGRLRDRWRQAEQDGVPPSPAECRALAAEADRLPYAVETRAGVQTVQRTGDCSRLDLDALAKGWIVDRAAEAGLASGVTWVMVNVGGDLRLVGPGPVRVAVEDPASTLDNAPPLAVVTMTSGGMASSGPARRGFQVRDQWFGHVLDPRTGWPVTGAAGVTVVADDTATADALTTVLGVHGLEHPLVAPLLQRARASALLVTGEGDVVPSHRWRDQVSFELTATS